MSLVLFGTMLSSQLHAAVHEVIVRDNSFSPATVIIEAGDTVRWINEGPGSHNVYAQGKFRCANGCEAEGGDGDASSLSWVAEVTFRVPDTIQYECEPHAIFGMFGTVVIQEPTTGITHNVEAQVDNTFVPADLSIRAGDVVYFTNQGGVHNFNTLDDSLICADGCVGDGSTADTNPTGFPWGFYIRFNEPAEIPYFCANPSHSEQLGILRVLSDVFFKDGFESL